MSDNLPVIQQIDYRSAEVIATLKATVAYGLNEPEFLLFTEHCKATGLNPFKKEVWAIKAGGRLQLMTGNSGFHAIANSHPLYDGIETGFVGKNGEYLPMTYPNQDYIGAWAKVYRKDRRIPLEAVAMLSEYDKGQSNWKTMKRIMIVKCAESLALRKAFPHELNGMYTQEEMPVEFSAPQLQVTSVDVGKGEMIEHKTVEAQPQATQQPSYGPINWESFQYRYHLPVKKEGVDMDAVRTWLKKNGFRFNPDDKHWYGNQLVEKISMYLRLEETEPKQAVAMSEDDDLPAWDLYEDEDAGVPNI